MGAVRILPVSAVAVIAVVGAACGGGDAPATIVVPTDEPTIQAAVDSASSGDTILIEPGVYREQIIVETDDLVIRGLDRNEVILEGGDELFDGFLVVSDGVAIENLTVQHFRQSGVIFTGQVNYGTAEAASGEPLERYRVSHVTAINNGTYGVYAFAARNGTISSTSASGHPDSGFYVGQCKPCDVVLDDVVAERNSIGYYGTNASGGVVIVNSVFRNNRLGLTPNSQDSERLAPQEGTVIAGNLVVDNDDPTAPAIPEGFFGGGIVIGGGIGNEVIRNRVEDHDAVGIGLLPQDTYQPLNNRIVGNVLRGNGIDIAVDTNGSPNGNCFADNELDIESPTGVTSIIECDRSSGSFDPAPFRSPPPPPPVDYRTVERPGTQPTMDDPSSPAVRVGAPPEIDLDTITVP